MNWLERRIVPPLVVLITAALMLGLAWVTPAVMIPEGLRWGLSGALFILALAFGVPAVLSFRRAGTTVNPVAVRRATQLVTDGVFAWSRNPMYLGMALVLLAWAVWLAAPWALLGPLAFVAYITRFQIMPEERALAEKFGAEYARYCENVRRWV